MSPDIIWVATLAAALPLAILSTVSREFIPRPLGLAATALAVAATAAGIGDAVPTALGACAAAAGTAALARASARLTATQRLAGAGR